MVRAWLSNLLNGLRLVCGIPNARQDFSVSLPFMLFALLLSIVLLAGIDYAQLDYIRYQDIRGTALLGSFFAIGLLLTVIAAHLDKDYPQLPVLLTILLSCLPWVAIVLSVFPYEWVVQNNAQWLLWLLLAGVAAVVVRCLFAAFYRPGLVTIVVPVVAMTCVALFSWERFYFPSVFDSYNPDEFADSPSIDMEYTLYQQQRLVEQALRQVMPSVIGETDYFFLGFGGSDRQTVFETETLYANELIQTQFNTQDHSMVLFNNADKLDEQPIANAYNLVHAINGFSRKMTPDEDVLIMLLTSHGSDDATLAVDLDTMDLKELNASELKATLDLANIKWRILIISACYSGSFIDVLEDPNTLIITASSADRSSFGCSSDRELTVFGEAFFKNALRPDNNWVTAFIEAEEQIRNWETQAELLTSNPQIRIGHDIRLKLGLPVPPAPTTERAE
ncbi:MAG: C13 family peptidase [Gammaproteobacteria bacterium]